MSRIVIVGGSDAGISAALRIRELDPASEVDVVLAWTPWHAESMSIAAS